MSPDTVSAASQSIDEPTKDIVSPVWWLLLTVSTHVSTVPTTYASTTITAAFNAASTVTSQPLHTEIYVD